jgi:hypothetical protein
VYTSITYTFFLQLLQVATVVLVQQWLCFDTQHIFSSIDCKHFCTGTRFHGSTSSVIMFWNTTYFVLCNPGPWVKRSIYYVLRNNRFSTASLFTGAPSGFYRKTRTRLDLLSIPQSGGKNDKTFRWEHRLFVAGTLRGSLFSFRDGSLCVHLTRVRALYPGTPTAAHYFIPGTYFQQSSRDLFLFACLKECFCLSWSSRNKKNER